MKTLLLLLMIAVGSVNADMEYLINLHGIRYLIKGNPASQEAKRRIHLAKLDVAELKKTHPGLNIARLERPGLYEIKSIHGIDEVRMTIPEVPVPPVKERRPIEEKVVPYVYRLAFRAYNSENVFRGLVMTSGLTWHGPYEFLPLEAAKNVNWYDPTIEDLSQPELIDPFSWGQWDYGLNERPYESDPRPSAIIVPSAGESIPEYSVVYPYHDGIADAISSTETPWVTSDWWVDEPAYLEECPHDSDLVWCKAKANRFREQIRTQDMYIPCCSKSVFKEPYVEYDREEGFYTTAHLNRIQLGFPGRPVCYKATEFPEEFIDEWVSPGRVWAETDVTRTRHLGWPYTHGAMTTYLSDGSGGSHFLEQYDHGTRRITVKKTPEEYYHPEHTTDYPEGGDCGDTECSDGIWTCMGWTPGDPFPDEGPTEGGVPGWGILVDTGDDLDGPFYNRSWKEKVVCDGKVYEINSGDEDAVDAWGRPTGGYFWNLPPDPALMKGTNPDTVVANPRYFKEPNNILALAVQRTGGNSLHYDYMLFSPKLDIEEAYEEALRFEHSILFYFDPDRTWIGYALLHELPMTGQDGEILYGNGQFELVRHTAIPIKIQTGEV